MREALLNSSIDELETLLKKEYLNVSDKLMKQLLDVYIQILDENGKPLKSHLYQFNRYYDLLNNITKELTKLGVKEDKVFDERLTNLYYDNSKILDAQFAMQTAINADDVQRAVKAYWVGDGLNYSDRIWKNKELLTEKLRSNIVEAVSTGKSIDKFTKDIKETFNVSFNEASRLARTEMSHVYNRSTYDRYEAAGIKKYRFLTAENEVEKYNANHDSEHQKGEVCSICSDINNKVFNMSEMQIGINYPPIHPNCRCTVLAVIDE